MKLNVLVMCSLAAALACGGCGSASVTVGPTSVPVEDNFFATWEIQSSQLGPVACEDVGAVRVDMDVVNTSSGERLVFSFPCNDYQGTSGEVGVGTFDVVMDLIDVDGVVLSQTQVGTENLSAAGTIDIGHHVFVVP